MTEYDLENQRLRREIERLKDKLIDYENLHQLDMAEITRLRRMIGSMEEGK